MTINIQPKNIVLRPEVSQTFTALNYVVTYDNSQDNSKLGLPPGMCSVQFKGATAPGVPTLEPIVILGTADWTDEQVDAEICKRLGVTVAAE